MTQNINNNTNLDAESNELYNYEGTRPVGWSAGCLDEAIFYYLDCNYVNMCNLENNDNVEK